MPSVSYRSLPLHSHSQATGCDQVSEAKRPELSRSYHSSCVAACTWIPTDQQANAIYLELTMRGFKGTDGGVFELTRHEQ